MEGRHEMLVSPSRAAGVPRGRRQGLGGVLAVIATGALVAGAWTAPARADRGYEMVSAVAKKLGAVSAVTRSSDTGDAVSYASYVAEDQWRSSGIYPSTLAQRGGDGWLRFGADPLVEGFVDGSVGLAFRSQLIAVSDDQTKALLLTMMPLQPNDTDVFGQDFYLEDLSTGESDLISTGPTDSGSTNVPDLVGASKDFSHIFFRFSGALTADASAGLNIYEWHNGSVRLASVLPNGTAATSAIPGAMGDAWTATTNAISGKPLAARGGPHAVSDDGSRIFFRQAATTYVRIDGTTSVPLSTSKRTSGTPAGGTLGQSVFMGANVAGSIAYFFSNQQLTDVATAGGGVYRYDIAADDLQLVTPPTPGGASSTVQQGGGISQDASTLYFVAKGALTPDATANQFNLYVWTADNGTHLISTTAAAPTLLRVSGDGRYALYTSTASLAGAQTGGIYKALYRYDRDTATLACVSCRSDAAASTADAVVEFSNSAWVSNPRALTDDGQVVFETQDQLLPEDTDTAYDVYLFDGDLHLISGGAGAVNSHVGDNDETAKNIFFATGAALVSQDTDGGLTDLYDARVGGGFPEPPLAPAPDCLGIDCAPAPPGRPGVPAAGSTGVGGSNSAPDAITTPRVRILSVSAATRRLLARRGWAPIPVEVTGGGTLVLTATAPLGGHLTTIASTRWHLTVTKTAKRAVVLRLSKSARQHLQRDGHLSLRLVARVGGLAGPETAIEKLTLKRASR